MSYLQYLTHMDADCVYNQRDTEPDTSPEPKERETIWAVSLPTALGLGSRIVIVSHAWYQYKVVLVTILVGMVFFSFYFHRKK